MLGANGYLQPNFLAGSVHAGLLASSPAILLQAKAPAIEYVATLCVGGLAGSTKSCGSALPVRVYIGTQHVDTGSDPAIIHKDSLENVVFLSLEHHYTSEVLSTAVTMVEWRVSNTYFLRPAKVNAWLGCFPKGTTTWTFNVGRRRVSDLYLATTDAVTERQISSRLHCSTRVECSKPTYPVAHSRMLMAIARPNWNGSKTRTLRVLFTLPRRMEAREVI